MVFAKGFQTEISLMLEVMRDILQSRYLRSNVGHKQLARTSLKREDGSSFLKQSVVLTRSGCVSSDVSNIWLDLYLIFVNFTLQCPQLVLQR